jgi:glutathione synthase/RimK-type ligase-like ATP-grasp enzyme
VAEHLAVVEKASDWKTGFPELQIQRAKDYLSGTDQPHGRGTRVLNLCRSYKYLSTGYYCSLLAEARGHRVLPTVRTINDLSKKSIYSLDFSSIDTALRRCLARSMKPATDSVGLDIFFGYCEVAESAELCRHLFEVFRMPLMRVELKLLGNWQVTAVRPLHLHSLDPKQEEQFVDGLKHHMSRRWREPKLQRTKYAYDLAILHDPQEPHPPSDSRALKKMQEAGRKKGVNVELIEKQDYGRLLEFDGLFIRETTGLNHHTYRFSKRAESEGLAVIDDPNSIVKCTNKVYLAELLRANRIPAPQSVIVRKDNIDELEEQIPYPVVLKIPDSSFSRGVFKAEKRADLEAVTANLFRSSDLILAQEFVYTPFDWRVGVLNGRPLFACRYFMSEDHWQIIKHGRRGGYYEGDWETFSIENAPEAVVGAAVDVAALIGDGLYGVDIKQHVDKVMVIEINENPNLEAGVEDEILGDDLYSAIIDEFVRRMEERRLALHKGARDFPDKAAGTANRKRDH